jgi:hypothetical protein
MSSGIIVSRLILNQKQLHDLICPRKKIRREEEEHRNTLRHKPDDSEMTLYRRKNLKSRINSVCVCVCVSEGGRYTR